jgi:hypothetical protein
MANISGAVQIETGIKHGLSIPVQSVAVEQSIDVGTLLMCALRALMLAAAKSAAEDEAKLDYLSSLPIEAWESDVVHTRYDMRDDTLAMIRNHLASWAKRA